MPSTTPAQVNYHTPLLKSTRGLLAQNSPHSLSNIRVNTAKTTRITNIITQDGHPKRFSISLHQESHSRRAKAARTNKFHFSNSIHTKKIRRQRMFIIREKMILIGTVSVQVLVKSPVRVLVMFPVHLLVAMRRKYLTLPARS